MRLIILSITSSLKEETNTGKSLEQVRFRLAFKDFGQPECDQFQVGLESLLIHFQTPKNTNLTKPIYIQY